MWQGPSKKRQAGRVGFCTWCLRNPQGTLRAEERRESSERQGPHFWDKVLRRYTGVKRRGKTQVAGDPDVPGETGMLRRCLALKTVCPWARRILSEESGEYNEPCPFPEMRATLATILGGYQKPLKHDPQSSSLSGQRATPRTQFPSQIRPSR